MHTQWNIILRAVSDMLEGTVGKFNIFLAALGFFLAGVIVKLNTDPVETPGWRARLHRLKTKSGKFFLAGLEASIVGVVFFFVFYAAFVTPLTLQIEENAVSASDREKSLLIKHSELNKSLFDKQGELDGLQNTLAENDRKHKDEIDTLQNQLAEVIAGNATTEKGRRLLGKNKNKFIEQIRQYAGNKIAIWSQSNAEASRYAHDILDAFTEAGWFPDGKNIGTIKTTPPFFGIKIYGKNRGEMPDHVRSVARAFISFDVIPVCEWNADLPDETPVLNVGEESE